jgi:hypothetical protein
VHRGRRGVGRRHARVRRRQRRKARGEAPRALVCVGAARGIGGAWNHARARTVGHCPAARARAHTSGARQRHAAAPTRRQPAARGKRPIAAKHKPCNGRLFRGWGEPRARAPHAAPRTRLGWRARRTPR